MIINEQAWKALERTFTDLIDTSIERQALDVSPLVEAYVVEMLIGFTDATHLVRESIYLKDLLRKALDSEGRMRKEYLRTTGDVALFVTGIFPDSLKSRRNSFNLGDYIDIGQKAYDHINADVFDELAVVFPEMVDVLNEVSMRMKLTSVDIVEYMRRRRYIDARVTRR